MRRVTTFTNNNNNLVSQLLANEQRTEFQMREQQNKTERNSVNRVSCSWMKFQAHARSLVELLHKCVPMRIKAKKTSTGYHQIIR